MAVNRGKQFESRVEADWVRTMSDSFILRIPDQVTGYKETSKNAADFLAHKGDRTFFIECKTTNKNTLSFSAIPQYERLLKYKGITNVYPGILVWWITHDEIAWIPIETAEKLVNEGAKSINVKILDDPNYNTLRIDNEKKRVFLFCDFNCLMKL